MSEKTRVSAFRPTPFRLLIALGVIVVLLVAGAFFDRCRKANQAIPMSGECTEVSLKHYVGGADKDGQVCVWKGLKYWCAYDPSKDIWDCTMIEPPAPASAEKK